MAKSPLFLTLVAVAVALLALAYAALSRRGLKRDVRSAAERLRDSEIDRERLQASLERNQQETIRLSSQLSIYETERVSFERELVQQQTSAADCRKQLAQANDQTAVLIRRQRELSDELNQVASIKTELQAEKKQHAESQKAITTTRLQLDRQTRSTVETQKLLAAERKRLQEKEAQLATLLSDNLRLQGEFVEAKTKLSQGHARLLELAELETTLAQLRARNADLEQKLTSVMQVASTVGEVELDREELQVRLETAAYSVRIARNEADRYRAKSESLESECSRLRAEQGALAAAANETLAAENRKLSYEIAQQRKELQALQSRQNELEGEVLSVSTRAEEATQELVQLQNLDEATRHEKQTLLAQVESLHQYSTQNEQLRAELTTVSQRLQDHHRSLAELADVRTELRNAQMALKAAQGGAQDSDRLRQTAQLLRDEQRSHLEAERRLSAVQAELQALKGGITVVHGKRMETEQLEQLREENLRLKEDIRQLRIHKEASVELDKLNAEHKRLRLESELLNQRVTELGAAREEATTLRREAVEQAQALNEATELRDRLGLLEAQLYALGQVPQTREVPRHSMRVQIGSTSHHMEAGLSPLVTSTNLRSAVLADIQGFPIVVAGETLAHEGLAAFSAVAQDLAQRGRRLLPLSDVLLVQLLDSNQITVTCRLFTIGQEAFSVATIGQDALPLARSEEVVQTLKQSLTGST